MYVGDYIEYNKQENVIESVYERKNFIVRPPLSNIDKMFVVLAPIPEPDLLLVDKLLVQCEINNIQPVLVINKIDLCTHEFLSSITEQYQAVVKIYKTSTLDSTTVFALRDEMQDNLCIFVGQSAVGKSSLVNVLMPNVGRMIGDISSRTKRGKNCTRESQIYLMDNARVADTTGFSALEVKDIDKEQLNDCYLEIKKYSKKCTYNTCNHYKEAEDICAVKKAVKHGKIPLQRYNRYIKLFEELKKLEDKKYA